MRESHAAEYVAYKKANKLLKLGGIDKKWNYEKKIVKECV